MGIEKPHLTCYEVTCVHEEVAIADSEGPLYVVQRTTVDAKRGEQNGENQVL